jgi:antibiotic biosynthesis monooxygenase (ABM) superfamily enzyme
MWVQVIQGKAKDEAGLRKQFDKWNEEIRPKATGFLGSTSGITDDGTFIAVARFENEELAMQNNDIPEQAAWFEETAQYFDGEPTFRNCSEVDTMRGGGSDDAGFVQIIQSEVKDTARARELNR